MNPAVSSQSENSQLKTHPATIEREDVRARLEDPDFVVVNVMPEEVFQEGYIPRSLNLPLNQIETHALSVLPDLTREYTIYCAGPT